MKFLHECLNPDYKEKNVKPSWNGYWLIASDTTAIGNTVKLENMCGGSHSHIITNADEIIDSNWDAISKLEATIDMANSDYGWIDLQGIFYGCSYREHWYCASVCFNLSEIEAENSGYIKIYQDSHSCYALPDGRTYYVKNNRMTKAQAKTLKEKGFDVRDIQILTS